MAREIIIDTDTVIGYNFQVSKYYIENKGTMCYRATKELAKEILDIVAPDNSVSLQDLQNLKDVYETLTDLYYTWYDNGSFIKTIQLNTYDKYPLTLDAFKQKLYIMNTNLIFDLTLNEGKPYRVEYLRAYYKDNIGLSITTQQMTLLYDTLVSYYAPTCYNEIDQTQLSSTALTTLYYNNIYSCSNYDESAKVVYSCTENPNNKYNKQNVSGIVALDTTNKAIALQGTPNTTLVAGQQVIISDLNIIVDGVTYSADGTYTVASTSGSTVTVVEALPFNYTFPYKKAILINSKTSITSINRDNLSITLSSSIPNTIQIGDIIHVEGTQQTIDNQSVSADGTYTVASLTSSTNTVIVQEVPNANYSGTGAYICKHIDIGNVLSIASKVVTVDATISPVLTTGTKILIDTEGTQVEYTVSACTSNTITVQETIEDYTPVYAQLQINTPYAEILVEITTSKNLLYPTGEFMVDDFAQCQAYITTYPSSVVPANSIHNNVNQQVATTISVTGLPTLQLKGVYSKIYTET